MSDRYVIEARLRPAVELNSATGVRRGGVCVCGSTLGSGIVSVRELCHRRCVCRFFRIAGTSGIPGITLPPESPASAPLSGDVGTGAGQPAASVSGKRVSVAAKHTQRLLETQRPEVERYVQPPAHYRLARQFELRFESRFPAVCRLLQKTVG